MSYKKLTSVLQNEEVLSSFSQNSSGKTHKWKGIINTEFFDLSETGPKQASLDKIADKIAIRFGMLKTLKKNYFRIHKKIILYL